ncbi:hypothetical protein [Parablautia muri]|nr:hypothetical protein [Parablautia muri]
MSCAEKYAGGKKNFEDEYFQNYSGATYMKEYSEDELAFTMNKIKERLM